jgi:hypothetical protein
MRIMALVYRAELHPTKLELLAAWLPHRPWFAGSASDVARVAGYRFDDSAGEVGIETLLVRADDGPLLQAPLTYRGAPLDGHDRWLVGTMEHSVLGRRWVYDGCGDPVYASALATAVLTGGRQADEFVDVDGRPERREPTTLVTGAGSATAVAPCGAIISVDDRDPTTIRMETVELVIRRVLDGTSCGGEQLALTGTWPGQTTPLPLAHARPL